MTWPGFRSIELDRDISINRSDGRGISAPRLPIRARIAHGDSSLMVAPHGWPREYIVCIGPHLPERVPE
jgi:hypothetical protein